MDISLEPGARNDYYFLTNNMKITAAFTERN
jgi:hypothetical protein